MTAIICSNLSPLADAYGAIDAEIKALEERKAHIRKQIESAIEDGDAVIGDRFTVVRKDVLSARLDTKALKAAFGDALDKFEKPSVSTRLSVKATVALDLVA